MNLIAVDLGASGGRVHLGRLTDTLSLTEIHRFEHRPIHLPDATPQGVVPPIPDYFFASRARRRDGRCR